ncbi:MAG: hypothetical protein V3V74_07330 [Nitrosomonadaceae bacterium]
MKTKLLASATSHKGIYAAIQKYYGGSPFLTINYVTGVVENSLGVIKGVRVVEKGKRLRFEQIEEETKQTAITKEQATKKANELIDNSAIYMKELVTKALSCGALNIDDYEDDFTLPRIIVHAALETSKFQNRPNTLKGLEESKNLNLFI